MTTEQLVAQIHKKKSFLCIGLDVDLAKIPSHLLTEEDPIFAFNKAIIESDLLKMARETIQRRASTLPLSLTATSSKLCK